MMVLVVDDDADLLALIEVWLKGAGHEVLTARDGSEAWSILQDQPVSVVLLDWLMPKMDGLELCRKIRSVDSDHYVYVILATTKTEREDMFEGMAAGVDDFITKPLDFELLAARLRVAKRVMTLRTRNVELSAIIPTCVACSRVYADGKYWKRPEEYVVSKAKTCIDQIRCPECIAARRAPEAIVESRAKKPKIVMIDDSEQVLEVTALILQEQGIDVIAVDNPFDAFATILREKPDLVLLDVTMPDLTGDRIVELTRQNPALCDTRVVLFSGMDEADLKLLVERCDADGFLRKNLKPEELIRQIGILLESQ